MWNDREFHGFVVDFSCFFQLSGGLVAWDSPAAFELEDHSIHPAMPTICCWIIQMNQQSEIKNIVSGLDFGLNMDQLSPHDTSWHQSQISSLSSSIIHRTASKPAKTRGAIAVHRNFRAWVHPWVFSFLQGTTCWNDSCKASWDLSTSISMETNHFGSTKIELIVILVDWHGNLAVSWILVGPFGVIFVGQHVWKMWKRNWLVRLR